MVRHNTSPKNLINSYRSNQIKILYNGAFNIGEDKIQVVLLVHITTRFTNIYMN